MTRRVDEVTAAIAELRAMRSSDPCAAPAIAAAKVTAHTLERHWLGDGPGPVAAAATDR